ncbi:MAG TPA: hypothetical protein VFB76_08120 [Candidatus Angelobacter sp.]|nr:hypothetical protein [Candidatus Angelobacter sp.]
MRLHGKTNVCAEAYTLESTDCGKHGQNRLRMAGNINDVRLHKRRMQRRHVLAAILAGVTRVMRARHAVTALHCLIARGTSRAVKRIHSKTRDQHNREDRPN